MRALVLLVLFVACGPSAAQIKQSREARYTASADAVFRAAVAAADDGYDIDLADPREGVFRTEPRWYEPDGTYEGKANDGSSMITDGSILLSLVVRVAGDDGGRWVEIEPLAVQHVGGSPQPRELAPDDPAMPGWVAGKIDNLYVAIHERLKAHVAPP